MALLGLILALGVAFFNGANDVSKAVATLVGSGVGRDRTAIIWGSVWTLLGALTAAFAAQGLVAAFSGRGLLVNPPDDLAFIMAVAGGALIWIWLATATGLPVSTTHAITGGLVGAGLAWVGAANIHWTVLLTKFALPLALGPLLALALVFLLAPLIHRGLQRYTDSCACVQTTAAITLRTTPSGNSNLTIVPAMPTLVIDKLATCAQAPTTIAGLGVVDALHWLTAGATAFARGLNDAPKVLGLGVLAAHSLSLPLGGAFVLVALAMTAGSLLRGFNVLETLSRKVTPMTPLDGLAANAATSLLVISASHWALPVSTTHISTGAIIGLGLRSDARAIRWKTVRDLAFAWIITLPVAAGLAAALVLAGKFISPR